jgi:6-phosphogluconolactonase
LIITIHLYVAVAGDDKLSIFTMEPDTGKLTHHCDVPQAAQPSPMAVDPAKQFCFVGLRQLDAFGLASFRIDAQARNLTPLGSIPVDGDPVYVSTDRTGRYLLSAYYYQGTVAVHEISDGGILDPRPIEWRQTDFGAHSIEVDASNQFVFVPHTQVAWIEVPNTTAELGVPPGGVRDGANAIFQFRFDATTGGLRPNDQVMVTAPGPDGPRHIRFHPNLEIIYSSDEQGSGVTAYHFDSALGKLTPFQTVSTLPAGFSGLNAPSEIRITPNGHFLYVANRGHNSIAGFAVARDTGRLMPIGHTSTEPIPAAFDLDPEGRFLISSGMGSGRLATYRIGAETGQLEPLDSYDVGQRPMGVLCVEL